MDANQLKQAGFSDEEVGQYTKLQAAGFSDKEISEHLSAPTTKPKTFGQKVATAVGPYARPVLETAGLLAGGTAGAASGLLTGPGAVAASPAGAVVGAGLGYAGGRSMANLIDQYAGEREAPTLVGGLKETGKDVLTGAGMEAGGALTGKAIEAVAPAVSKVASGLSEKWKIPTTIGEKSQSPLMQRIETLNERVPFSGMTTFRKAQQEATHQAAKKFLGDYIANPEAPNIEGNRAFADSLYKEVKGLVAQVPNQEIKPSQTKPIAEALLRRYPDIFKKLQDTKTEGLIQDIVKGVKDEKTPASTILGPSGKPAIPASSKPKTLTFDEAWELRKGLGEKIGQARKLLASGQVDQTAYGQLKSLFSSISNDMDTWAGSIGKPEISEGLKSANDAYKQYVVRYDVLSRAYDKVTREVGDKTFFSPQRFSNALDSIVKKDRYLKTFTPEQRTDMVGLANIMQVAKRAGQFMENPPTGNRAVDLILAGGSVTTPEVPISWVTTFLTTTQPGQKLLTAAAKMQPGSPEMANMISGIYALGLSSIRRTGQF